MGSEVSAALYRLVGERAWHVCEYCLVHEQDIYHGCEVDHIRSVKHGGLPVAENLAWACLHCNRHKGTDLGSVNPAREHSSGSTIRGQTVGRIISTGARGGSNP